MAYIRHPSTQARVRDSEQAQITKRILEQPKRNLKLLTDGGVPIAMGPARGTPPGRWQDYFEHVVLELMVQAGMTPMEAGVAATRNSAWVMRLNELGTLEPAKWPNLVVLDANPLDDIRNTRQIDSVWIAGKRLHWNRR